jgi:ABC-2 type transport system permease protein
MSAVITLALKDLKLLIRNRASLFWILVFPLLLALFFGLVFGGGGSVRALGLAVVVEDDSEAARALVERLGKSDALDIETLPREQAKEEVRKGKRVAYLVIPKDYGKTAGSFGGQGPPLEVGIDPSRRAERGVLEGILTQTLFADVQESFQDPKKLEVQVKGALRELNRAKGLPKEEQAALTELFGHLLEFSKRAQGTGSGEGSQWQPAKLDIQPVGRVEEEPRTPFEITFPSSILWGILGCVQSFIISIVGERIGGTFLRLRVAPVTWGQVLAGKALACFLACSAVSLLLLTLGGVVFGVRLEHPLHLLLAILATACCFVGILMLLATLGRTIEGTSGAAWGILMPMAMIGGGMIPLIAMPDWMLRISNFSPVKWGIYALEGAVWRGFRLQEMLLPCGILIAIGVICFLLGVRKLSWGEG